MEEEEEEEEEEEDDDDDGDDDDDDEDEDEDEDEDARSAELAVTSLISNKREWNNCFIKFLKLQKFGSTNYERKKRENPSEIEKT